MLLSCLLLMTASHVTVVKSDSIESLRVLPRSGKVVLVGQEVILDLMADITTTLWPPVVVRVNAQHPAVLHVVKADVPIFWNQTRHIKNDSDAFFTMKAMRPGRSELYFNVLEKSNQSVIGKVNSYNS